MATTDNVELLVREGKVDEFRFTESPPPADADLRPNEILVRVEKFGFSANNLTYAVIGRSFRYFEFFPAADEGWGKVPVWGMGEVVRSRHPELPPGTRMYGYFPLARYVTLLAGELSAAGFEVDRGSLPAVYNQYALVGRDPFHLPAQEDQMMLFRPLFFTSLLLDDYLAHHDHFGADAVVISSASSKTSYGLAFMLGRRRADADGGRRHEIIGLTSRRNAEFVRSLGLYDRVVTYDALAALPADLRAVVVDVAGNPDTLQALGAHLGDNLKASILVGIAHWDKSNAGSGAGPGMSELPPGTEFFFAPSWVEQRQREWGVPRLVETLSNGWRAFMESVDRRCRLAYGGGKDAVAGAYRAMLAGEQQPDEGRVLSLWDDAFDAGRSTRKD